MDINKIIDSKFFRSFDWIFRLLIINFFIITIIGAVGIVPFLIWYKKNLIVFLFLAIFICTFIGITCLTAALFTIKHYKEERTGNIFYIYFKHFTVVFKNMFFYNLIISLILFLVSFGAIYYWDLLATENYPSSTIWQVIAILGFVISFFSLWIINFMIINASLLTAYLRMTTKTLFKLSFYMTFKYFVRSFFNLIILIAPIFLILWIPAFFIPFYILIGISLPLYIIFVTSYKNLFYISHNIDDIREANKYDLKGEENEIRD